MTDDEKLLCYRADYMSYGFPSRKALCSQPPIQCPFETGETIKLKTEKRITIYYCTRPKKVKEKKEGTKKEKLSCRLDGT